MSVLYPITYCSLLLLCTLWDLKTLRLPNALTLPGFLLLLTLIWTDARRFPKTFLLSALISFVILTVLSLLTKGKLGMGDAKLTLSIGGTLGLHAWFFSLTAASLSALVFALIRIARKKMDRNTPIPFAPFLAFGGLLFYWIKPEDLLGL